MSPPCVVLRILALVAVGGGVERVAIDLVPDARPGDVVLCHAGIALERLDREPA